MDYLQYIYFSKRFDDITDKVLNLIINGLPSIHRATDIEVKANILQF